MPRDGRLRAALLKPVAPDASSAAIAAGKGPSVEELEGAVKSANDKERLVGLLAAPAAAAIGLLVTGALIANDPPELLKNGHLNKLHVSVSLYHNLMFVLLGLSVLMLVMALLRKRLYLGITMALYGLAIFNLHYWGFGIPFLMFGSWLLVRSYRIQRDLREANGDRPPRPAGRAGGSTRSKTSSPQASKRYTPPTLRRKHPSPPKRERQSQAG